MGDKWFFLRFSDWGEHSVQLPPGEASRSPPGVDPDGVPGAEGGGDHPPPRSRPNCQYRITGCRRVSGASPAVGTKPGTEGEQSGRRDQRPPAPGHPAGDPTGDESDPGGGRTFRSDSPGARLSLRFHPKMEHRVGHRLRGYCPVVHPREVTI